MRQVILDTSFIMASIRQKIDFFERFDAEGFQVVIPGQTIKELKGLGENLALKILEKNDFRLIDISGKDADRAIINFAKKNPKAFVATIDAGLKKKLKKLKNNLIIIRQRKKLEII